MGGNSEQGVEIFSVIALYGFFSGWNDRIGFFGRVCVFYVK
jgi:hypothetical protein